MGSNPILLLILTVMGFLLYFYLKTEKKIKNLKPTGDDNSLSKKLDNEISVRSLSYQNLDKNYKQLSSSVNTLENDIINTNSKLHNLDIKTKITGSAVAEIKDSIKDIEEDIKKLKKLPNTTYVTTSEDGN